MTAFGLSEKEYDQTLNSLSFYRREAGKCLKGKSYFGANIIAGAAVEAALILMCECYSDEIPRGEIPRYKDGRIKNLLRSKLSDLIRVARKCGWLPAGLELFEEWNSKKALVGDFVVVLQQYRNLIHPARFIKDFNKSRMTKAHAELCLTILYSALGRLNKRIHDSFQPKVEVGNEK